MVKIAVLGYGVVGSGVVEVIKKNSESIARRAGDEINIGRILDIRDFSDSPDRDLFTKNAEDIFNDSSIEIVVETIGGARAAYEFTKRAFLNKKHVVTSNKELVASHGPELLALAQKNGVQYLFEASVGGGIPIIRPLHQCLSANEITGITGILNGTTNYILTKMKNNGYGFEEALKEAQQNGYAEADPTADVEGHDACRKIAILSSIAYNQYVNYEYIHTEGISRIKAADMLYAEELDSVIKLVAVSRKQGDKVFARVSPLMIPKSNPLANVDDVFNAIVVKGDAIGEAMFYGRGAGKLPTASAVVADIIDIVKHGDAGYRHNWEIKDGINVLDIAEDKSLFYTRVAIRNQEEAKRFIIRNFGEVEFIEPVKAVSKEELAFVTKEAVPEGDFSKNIELLKGIGSIRSVENTIRIEA